MHHSVKTSSISESTVFWKKLGKEIFEGKKRTRKYERGR